MIAHRTKVGRMIDMQKLILDPTWESTLSIADSEVIQKKFSSTVDDHDCLAAVPIWKAVNHKGDLLITTLIHNRTSENIIVFDRKVVYLEGGSVVASHIFTIKRLVIGANCSTPWTFIFPRGTFQEKQLAIQGREEVKSGELRLS